MDILITYSITNDITAGKVHLKKLENEIISSGHITDYGSLSKAEDVLEIIGGSINDQSGLDAVIAAHTGEDLDDVKYNAAHAIDKAAGAARARYITVSEGQDATYVAKEADARAYKEAGYPVDTTGYPFVQANANADNVTPQVSADTIIATATAWKNLAATIEEIRLSNKNAINSETSLSEIEIIKNQAISTLGAI